LWRLPRFQQRKWIDGWFWREDFNSVQEVQGLQGPKQCLNGGTVARFEILECRSSNSALFGDSPLIEIARQA
jgi:hypothetical protein